MSGAKKKSEPREAPRAVVHRLSLYLRELQRLIRDGEATVNSSALGSLLGLTDAQVRKDLAYFGQFGMPGVGYPCDELVRAIKRILGTDREWVVALVGVGNLGRALLGYRGFASQGVRLVAAIDADPSLVGRPIDGLDGLTVEPLDRLEQTVKEHGVTLGLIAAPAESAQEIADRLVAAGVSGILNFAPVTLVLPPHVSLVGVDLATELEQLSFAVANRPLPAPKEPPEPVEAHAEADDA